jgi:4'-phosphopantetheinyl transferase
VTARVSLQEVAEVPEGDGWLSPEEREVQATLRFPKRRRDWRLGRWAAKRAVGRTLWVAPVEVQVAAADDGAPQASAGARDAPAISISHADGRGLCAVAPPGVTVGCDLEVIEPRSPAFVREWLTGPEQLLVAAAGPAGDLVATLVWSAKESASKALREGLRLPTRSVQIELPEDAPRPSLDARGWQPLVAWVRIPGVSLRWTGWWRTDGRRVITIVADREVDRPVDLAP